MMKMEKNGKGWLPKKDRRKPGGAPRGRGPLLDSFIWGMFEGEFIVLELLWRNGFSIRPRFAMWRGPLERKGLARGKKKTS